MTTDGFKVGDEVLAPWMDDGFLYPAIVVRLAPPQAHVAYLDGDEATGPVTRMRYGVLGRGLSVSVNFKGKGRYYTGTILERIGPAIDVAYADGDRGWATIAQCRVSLEILSHVDVQSVACQFCGAALRSDDARCGSCGAPRPGR